MRYASRMSSLTADQASFMLHTLGLPALRAEHPFTTAVIAAIRAGGADYRPHADSRSAFELAWHLVSAEIKYFDAVADGVFPYDLKPVPNGVRTPADILAWPTPSTTAGSCRPTCDRSARECPRSMGHPTTWAASPERSVR